MGTKIVRTIGMTRASVHEDRDAEPRLQTAPIIRHAGTDSDGCGVERMARQPRIDDRAGSMRASLCSSHRARREFFNSAKGIRTG
jgi:hypothetical protein